MTMFIVTTTAIMLFVLILFNIAMHFYFERNVRTELRNTFSTMNVLIEKQLMQSVISDSGGSDALLGLSAALTASHLTGNTEFFIFDKTMTLVFPEETQTLNIRLKQKIDTYPFSEPGTIEKVRTGDGTYLIAGMLFDNTTTGQLHIVFIAGTTGTVRLSGTMNLLLIAIMFVSLAIGIIYAVTAAKSLTRPIRNVCQYAREIGNGHFITVPSDASSLETSELITSINEMSERLKSSDQAQKLFLQNASHELRTPLMSIQGYSEAIENGIGYDPKEAAKIIKAESIRLTSLVEELITLSKIDNNIYDRAFQSVDLGEAIADCVDRLGGIALKENKKIIPMLIDGIMVSADDGLLSKVLGNVVSNAIRYAKSEVLIKMDIDNGEVVVTVSDDGDGFESENPQQLFDRFYKGRGGKFGLGLAIAHKALEIMGGNIEAINKDTGADFVIRLPIGGIDNG